MTYQFEKIGIVHSPFKQKFAIPRQPGLVAVNSSIEILAPFDVPEAFDGLEEFSHIWVSFIFHKNIEQGYSNQVRPPRLGGNKKLGVFATRSTFRPNPIGLSVVKLEKIKQRNGKLFIEIQGADFLDGTPVIDIKPYLPYADNIDDARGGFAASAPASILTVTFSESALKILKSVQEQKPELENLIVSILAQDPRPAYKKNRPDTKEYSVLLDDFDVCFLIDEDNCTVTNIRTVNI